MAVLHFLSCGIENSLRKILCCLVLEQSKRTITDQILVEWESAQTHFVGHDIFYQLEILRTATSVLSVNMNFNSSNTKFLMPK